MKEQRKIISLRSKLVLWGKNNKIDKTLARQIKKREDSNYNISNKRHHYKPYRNRKNCKRTL